MSRVDAEVVVRSNIDTELGQLTKEAEESLATQIPNVVQSFQQACKDQIQQLSGFSERASTTASQASDLASQAREIASKAPIRPAVSQPRLNTDQLSNDLSAILSEAQASLTELCTNYQNVYTEDVVALTDHANALWAVFEGKAQAVKGKLEEVKAKYSA